MPEPTTTSVVTVREGDVGRIILDRSHALNALDLPMVRQIRAALEEWRHQPPRAVTIESSTPGAFCAGGDIRQVRQNTLDGTHDASIEFFTTEYAVNLMLASYPVPVVALIDGLCLGGGMGLSMHGPFRVVTERASLAMPETAIGFFTDVGASHFLSRLPGGVGAYLGLTGARVGAVDSCVIGLATHLVATDEIGRIPGLLAQDGRPVDVILRELGSTAIEAAPLAENRVRIDHAFTGSTLEAIRRRLDCDGSQWAHDTAQLLDRMSPQSLRVTLDLILWGRQRSLSECLDAELEVARRVIRTPDFIEGVRAALVDKDRTPRWSASEYLGTHSDGSTQWADS
jgi:enoyl-CoA hydratase